MRTFISEGRRKQKLYKILIALVLLLSVFLITVLFSVPVMIVVVPFISADMAAVMFLFSLPILFLIEAVVLIRKRSILSLSGIKALLVPAAVFLLLSICLHTVSVIWTGRELAKTMAQARAAGLKLSIHETVPPPVPEGENAAVLYNKAFSLRSALAAGYGEKWSMVNFYYRYKGREREIKAIVLDAPDAIKLFGLLERAVTMEKCRFELHRENGLLMTKMSGEMRETARFLRARAYILAHEGKGREALHTMGVGIGLGRAFDGYPFVLSELIKIGIERIAFYQGDADHPPAFEVDPDSFRKLSAVMESRRDRRVAAVRNDVAITGDYLWGAQSGHTGKDIGCTLLHPDTWSYGWSNLLYLPVFKPVMRTGMVYYLKQSMLAAKLMSRPYYEVSEAANHLDEDSNGGAKIFRAGMFISGWRAFYDCEVMHDVRMQGFEISLALKAYKSSHGSYPITLDVLVPELMRSLPVDPFTGHNFRYQRQGKGFILYSLGANQKDDGGKEDKTRNMGDDKSHRDDIAWSCRD
ncbi:MAG: hypothetical protein PHT33_02450 [bacterium]|nr:hypothetical protein [bacterium]